MFKRFACCLLSLFVFCGCSFVKAENFNISAESCVLINSNTQTAYFNKQGNKKLPMASTTKIMTAVILCENAKLDQVVKITYNMIAVEGSSMGLAENDRITYYGLLCGMLLASGNDAANAVAISVAGSIENFAKLMNAKAKDLGMNNTNFVTPSGLDDKNHYSTAHDMALLTSYALKNEVIKSIVSKTKIEIEFGNPVKPHTVKNHNKLLNIYKSAVGVKTGFTKKSGRCLVSAAEKNGITLICVTLNDPNDWNDHCNLFNYGFELFKKYNISKRVNLSKVNLVGANKNNACLTVENLNMFLTEQDINNFSYKAYLPKIVYASSKKTNIGKIDYYINNNYIATSTVFIKKDYYVKQHKKSFLQLVFINFCMLISG